MISSICALLQAVLVLLAIGTGATVLFGFLTGQLLDKWAVTFLRCSLAASVIWLVVPFHQFEHITLPLCRRPSCSRFMWPGQSFLRGAGIVGRRLAFDLRSDHHPRPLLECCCRRIAGLQVRGGTHVDSSGTV